MALLGPTLLDIAHHVSGSNKSVSVIFTVRSFGHFVGSITGGVLYDKYRTKRYAMLSISVVTSALCKYRHSLMQLALLGTCECECPLLGVLTEPQSANSYSNNMCVYRDTCLLQGL